MAIIPSEFSELNWIADSRLKGFVHAIDEVCSQDKNSLVVLEFAKKHFLKLVWKLDGSK